MTVSPAASSVRYCLYSPGSSVRTLLQAEGYGASRSARWRALRVHGARGSGWAVRRRSTTASAGRSARPGLAARAWTGLPPRCASPRPPSLASWAWETEPFGGGQLHGFIASCFTFDRCHLTKRGIPASPPNFFRVLAAKGLQRTATETAN